jgi:hypothetical protein
MYLFAKVAGNALTVKTKHRVRIDGFKAWQEKHKEPSFISTVEVECIHLRLPGLEL